MRKGIFAILVLLMCQSIMAEGDFVLRINNGEIERTITCFEGHVEGTEYRPKDSGSFIKPSKEFSFLANDTQYSGQSNWTDFQVRDTTTTIFK